MLIIDVGSNEGIDRALKRYKRKHQQVKQKQELLDRKFFTKPSVKRRNEKLDAIYRERKKLTP